MSGQAARGGGSMRLGMTVGRDWVIVAGFAARFPALEGQAVGVTSTMTRLREAKRSTPAIAHRRS